MCHHSPLRTMYTSASQFNQITMCSTDSVVMNVISTVLSCELFYLLFPDRLYWSFLSMLPVWKECRDFGFWYTDGVLRNPFHLVGIRQYTLLLSDRWDFIGFTGVLCVVLCLWIPQGSKIKI